MSNKLNIKYLQKIRDNLFQISKSVHDIDNIDELYKIIHHCIADTIETNNFYIAILNNKTNSISFPYYVDVHDSIPQESIELGKGLTSIIIKTSKPLLINKMEYKKLVGDDLNSKLGTTTESW